MNENVRKKERKRERMKWTWFTGEKENKDERKD